MSHGRPDTRRDTVPGPPRPRLRLLWVPHVRRVRAPPSAGPTGEAERGERAWRDTLDRDFDFYLECLPQDPGPREVILPHNPLLTREMEVRRGDLLIGRPLGMSCGCPITHCGVALDVDPRKGPRILRRRGVRGPGSRGALRHPDRGPVFLPAPDVHAPVASQRSRQLRESLARRAARSPGGAVDRIEPPRLVSSASSPIP